MSVSIIGVAAGSPADKAGIEPGSQLLSIGKHSVEDVLDYRFYSMEERLKLTVLLPDGAKKVYKIRKEEEEDLGLEFETYLMSKQTGCKNKCIFCFIDQLPKGMRKTLYFKDDDERLSFLFGNYITLTNLDEEHINRIIKMRISPINISVHTVNPELRIKMMKNPNAGAVLSYLPKLAEAGIFMNVQLVLCPGWNDGEELERSLKELSAYFPQIQSIACVPVGLTKFRDGLEELRSFGKETAGAVIDIIEYYSDRFLKEYGERMAYPADEFFLLAERPIPDISYYGELNQLENGVGMSALLSQEFMNAMDEKKGDAAPRECAVATSVAAYPLLSGLVDEARKKWHNLNCKIIPVSNRYFGEKITVAGLITGCDLLDALQENHLPENCRVLFPASMLRAERDVFLDDMTPEEISCKLKVKMVPVENDGYELLSALLEE